MSLARSVDLPAGTTPVLPAWGRFGRACRVALVVGWLVMAVLVAVVGARESSFHDLERAVAAGEVDEVRVEGGLPPGSRGHATVRVTWRTGLVADTTRVREQRPLRSARGAGGVEVTAVVSPSVADRLRELDPDLEVRRVPSSPPSSWIAMSGRWHLGGWAVWPLLALTIATVLSVVASPPPWRATRWAWFWVFGSGPLGLAAYLLLAGPLPWLRERLSAPQRLTGGWAFLLSMLLAAVAGW